jgi:predicted ATPase
LLVLDNFEQVIEAAPAIGELLAGAPGCSAIVTSWERPALGAEQEQRLPSLAGGRRDLPSAIARCARRSRGAMTCSRSPSSDCSPGSPCSSAPSKLDAVEQICDSDLDTLQSLIDKSLVRHVESGRFFLLETTREYALEQFERSDERNEIRARHARWYFALGVAEDAHHGSARMH